MARYTGPTSRINRRFGMAIYGPSKAADRKPYPPGQHGARMRRRVSDFSLGLAEKQKLRFMYGLTEKQFRRTFERAKRQRGVTGEIFQQLLETRLDNVVYQLGMARSRFAARQFVNHGHIKVNGHKVDIASYQCKPGDEIEVREKSSSRQLATRGLEETQYRTAPAWLSVQPESLKGTVNRQPTHDEMESGINLPLIVEFYSR